MIEDRRTRIIDNLVVKMVGDLIHRMAEKNESVDNLNFDIDIIIETACRVVDKTIAATTKE